MKIFKKTLQVMLSVSAILYGASVAVMAHYFYSQAAEQAAKSQDRSWLDVLSAPFPNVPIWRDKSFFRAIAWPYVIWFDKTYSEEREAAKTGHANGSPAGRQRDAVQQLMSLLTAAVRMHNEEQEWTNTPIKEIPQSAFDDYKRMQKQILDEGPKIDIDALNRVYPQLGTMFSEKFLRSFQQVAAWNNDAGKLIDRSQAKALVGLTNDEVAKRLDADSVERVRQARHLEVEFLDWFRSKRSDLVAALHQNQ